MSETQKPQLATQASRRSWLVLMILACLCLSLAEAVEAQVRRDPLRRDSMTRDPMPRGQMNRDQMMRERNRQDRMGDRRQRSRPDAIERHFYSPEVVMRLQEEINLTPDQRATLIAELQSAQSDMVPLQFEVKEAQTSLGKLVRQEDLAEKQVVDQARRVMDAEAEVRARHLTLLIRIKNLLTSEQKAHLDQMRQRFREESLSRR
ncbi:MAG: Spy/CpxP family protein refolding chaperone [Deltaproteobacteria bacterium]|nr:Spy/CpxP family protein refolding chaperone [Deltaproteobacteria bacterium]